MLLKHGREKNLSCKGSVHKKTSAVSLTLSKYFPLLPKSFEADLVSASPFSLNIQLKYRKEHLSSNMKDSQLTVPSLKCRERKKNSMLCLSPRYCLPLVAKFRRQTHAWLETCLCQKAKKEKMNAGGKKKQFQ